MRDVFGADAPAISEGTTKTPGPSVIAAAASAVPAPPGAVPAPAPGTAVPTLQQAVDKAVAKAQSDQQVAADPHATHAVKLAVAAPTVLGSAAAGAVIGSALFPGPGTLVGAGLGWALERYQIGGGPFGKLWGKVKSGLQRVGTLPTPPHA